MSRSTKQVVSSQPLKIKRATLLILAALVCGLTFSSCSSSSGYKAEDEVVKEAQPTERWRVKILNNGRSNDGTLGIRQLPVGFNAGDTVYSYGKFVLINKIADSTAK